MRKFLAIHEPLAAPSRVAAWIEDAFRADGLGEWNPDPVSDRGPDLATAFDSWRRWRLVAWQCSLEADALRQRGAGLRRRYEQSEWSRLVAACDADRRAVGQWRQMRQKAAAAGGRSMLRRACSVWRAEARERARLASGIVTGLRQASGRGLVAWRKAAARGPARRHVGIQSVRNQITALLHSAPSPL